MAAGSACARSRMCAMLWHLKVPQDRVGAPLACKPTVAVCAAAAQTCAPAAVHGLTLTLTLIAPTAVHGIARAAVHGIAPAAVHGIDGITSGDLVPLGELQLCVTARLWWGSG